MTPKERARSFTDSIHAELIEARKVIEVAESPPFGHDGTQHKTCSICKAVRAYRRKYPIQLGGKA